MLMKIFIDLPLFIARSMGNDYSGRTFFWVCQQSKDRAKNKDAIFASRVIVDNSRFAIGLFRRKSRSSEGPGGNWIGEVHSELVLTWPF